MPTQRVPLDTTHFTYKDLLTRVAVLEDENQRLKEQHHTKLQSEVYFHVLSLILMDAPLIDILTALVASVEKQHSPILCSVLLLDETGKHLHVGAAPSFPQCYLQAVEGAAIGPTVASCGTAAYLKKRIIVSDTQSHPLWQDYKALATQANIAACWSEPILNSTGRVLGTFAMSHHEAHTPTELHIQTIAYAAQLAALAIECQQSQDRLKASEAHFRMLWETTSDVVLVLDEYGDILYANPATQTMFGYFPTDVIHKNVSLLQPPLLSHTKYFKTYLQTKQPPINGQTLESFGLHHNGLPFPIGISFSQVSINQRPMFAGFIRDISTRKQSERLLAERTQELQTSNQQLQQLTIQLEAKVAERTSELEQALATAQAATHAKSQFLAMMSHEIRTPISGIIGMTQLLSMTSISDEQANYLQTIQSSSQTLSLLINDILDLSKIEAGKLELEERAFNLVEELNSILSLYKPLADNKSLQLHHYWHQNLPSVIIGDHLRIRQIISNFLANAIKFTPHGEILVCAQIEHVAEQPQLFISVKDTGIGIPANRQHRLFQVFSQVDSSTTRQYGGSGLGLAICARLVEAMGGSIHVDSHLDQGSTFSFKIPYQIGNLDIEMPDTHTYEELKFIPNVLVVDDNEINQMVMSNLLQHLSIDADVANSGVEAIAKLNTQRFDVIFMDIQMPDMDGIATTQYIRSMSLYKQPYIIALTANAFDSDRQRCFDAGMNDFIAKPFLFEDIKDKLQELLANSPQR